MMTLLRSFLSPDRKTFLYFVSLIFRQTVLTFRDISLWYFTTYIGTKSDFQNKRNDKIVFIVTELSPFFSLFLKNAVMVSPSKL